MVCGGDRVGRVGVFGGLVGGEICSSLSNVPPFIKKELFACITENWPICVPLAVNLA